LNSIDKCPYKNNYTKDTYDNIINYFIFDCCKILSNYSTFLIFIFFLIFKTDMTFLSAIFLCFVAGTLAFPKFLKFSKILCGNIKL